MLPQIRICKTLYAPLCHPYREENDTELIELVGSWYLVMQNMDVVVRSRSHIVKPDALFVVFLGIKWAHDIVKDKSIVNSWVILALKCWPF